MMPSETRLSKTCWLFCSVIDNFGDIGVSWRLASMLSGELGWRVCLWTDDASVLRMLCPDLPPVPCDYRNIHINVWNPHFSDGLDGVPRPDVLIETFGCDLPSDVLEIARREKPVWLNWEYLSAEEGHERLHGLPSPQAGGVEKYFWFMGFSDKSGGLLREKDYHRQAFFDEAAFRGRLKLPPKTAQEWLLFGYEGSAWIRWLEMWRQAGEPVTLLLAGGKVLKSLEDAGAVPRNALKNDGDIFQTASVRLIKIPFVAQTEFDRLLHLSDGLIVRGEDSFVRAQLSGKLFLWHIYPQEENVHLEKLDAFWQRCRPFYSPDVFDSLQILSKDLNGGQQVSPQTLLNAWRHLQGRLNIWQAGAAAWSEMLARQESAVEKLAKFLQPKLK